MSILSSYYIKARIAPVSDAMVAKNIVILQPTVYSSQNPRELEGMCNTVEFYATLKSSL